MKTLKLIISVFLLSIIFLFSCDDCKVTPNAQLANSMVKPMLDSLQQRNYPINDLEYDAKGFPFSKGEYVVKFIFNDLRNGIKGFKEGDTTEMKRQTIQLMTKVKGYGKCFKESDIKFKFCECGSYALMTINSTIVGSPTPQDVKSTSTSSDIIDINPNYINYHAEATPFTNLPSETPNPPQKPNRSQGLVDVAILDTGIRGYVNNRENVSTINNLTCTNNNNEGIYGINFMNETNPNIYSVNVLDNNGHGTHVTGIIDKIYGKTDFITVGVQDNNGVGELYAAVCGIKYAVRKGAKIINGSWIFHNKNPENLSILKSAIEEAGKKNVLFISAVGNDGKEVAKDVNIYPAMFYDNDISDADNVIVVGAWEKIDEKYQLASYSNFGRKYVDILAKGYTKNYYLSSELGIELFSKGTSFATPIVTGYLINSNVITQPFSTIKNSFYNNSSIIYTDVNSYPQVNNGRYLLSPSSLPDFR